MSGAKAPHDASRNRRGKPGAPDAPLLFDARQEPKAAYWAVVRDAPKP